MRNLLLLLAAASAACGSSGGALRPDDAPATADVDALGDVAMCSSTYDDVVKVLGEPYRNGVASRMRIVSWKLRPGEGRAPEPVVIAFRPADGVAVDLCYDIPGLMRCELVDRC